MSQQNTEQVYNRSPRYVLQLKDKKILRYAPFPKGNRAFFTEIVNLSETGMAFTVPFLDSPYLGEIIMVEFTPPGKTAMACYAVVKRIQKYTLIESDFFQKNCKLVAVQFTQLKEEQKATLRKGLGKEFLLLQNQFRRQQLWLKLQWYWKFKKAPLLAGATGLAMAIGSSLTYFFR